MSLAQLFYLKESIRKRVRRRFPRKAARHSSQFTMEPLENRLLLSVTPVAPDLTTIANATNLEPNPVTQSAGTNEVVSFQLDYQDTGTGTGTSGLGLRIHYDSRQLRPGEAGLDGQFSTPDDVAVLTSVFAPGGSTLLQPIQDQLDTSNFDGNANTDRFVLVAWVDLAGAFTKGPQALLVANFTTLSPAITPVGQPASTFTGTTINFTTSSRPINRALNATSATITFDDPIRESVPGQPVTIVGPAGSLISGVTSIATPPNAPQGVTFPHGFFGLTIQDNSRVAGTALAAGGSITVDLLLPSTTNPNTYWKFGPEAGNATPHFYEFLFDGTTGAQFDNDVDIDPGAGVTLVDRVRLTYVDGGRGDADGLTNGIIVDPGAPGVEAGDTTAPVLTGDFVNDTGFIDFNGVPGAGATDGTTSDLTLPLQIVDASPITRLDVALAKNGGPFSPFNSLLDLLQPDGTLTITNARWETIFGGPLAPGPFGTGYQVHAIVEDAFGNRLEILDVFPERAFTFDNTAPESPGFITAVNGIAGLTQTNDSTPTLTIDPFESFGVVHVFANGLEIGSHIVVNLAPTDTFAFTPTTPLADGLYTLQLRAEDIAGNLTALALSSPLVLLIDTIAPVITSNGGGAAAAINTPENSVAVTTVTATDVNPLQFSIVGGADAAKFQLTGTGNNRSLSFLTAPDFETPTDNGTNNVYDVIVQVTDGIFSDQQTIAVTVTDVAEVIPNLTINDVALAEGTSLSGFTSFNFLVTLSAQTANAVTVEVATFDSNTTAGVDYTAVPLTTLTFAPGEISKTVTVQVRQDDLQESDEQFLVQLSNATNATIAGSGFGLGTITNDDTRSLTISDRTLAEGTSLAGFTAFDFVVTLSGATISSNVTVEVATFDSNTTAGVDYTAVPLTTLTFAPGETTKTVTVLVRQDDLQESDEQFLVQLSNATNATIAGSGFGLGTITNDDTRNLTISDVTLAEGTSLAGFTAFNFLVTLSAATITSSVTVEVATFDGSTTAGADYTAVPLTTLTFAPGETTKTVTVLVRQDNLHEFDETFGVLLNNATNATITGSGGAVGTITNDDFLSFSINDVTVTEGDSGTANATFTVTLSSDPTASVTVQFATANDTATAGSDYQTTIGTLTFNPGESLTQTINVAIVGDVVPEQTEQFFVNLSNATGGALIADAQGIGTILDNDIPNQPPVVTDQSFTIAENSTNGTVVGTIAANDPDVGQALSYLLTGTAFAVNTTTGQITVANSALLNFETTPSFSLTATVTDNGTPNLNDTAVITINLTDVNEAPVLEAIGNKTIDELATLSFLATATDVDAEQTATFTLDATSLGLGMTINATTGAFSWTPTEAQGPLLYNVTITVTDNGSPALSDSETIQIQVNEVNVDPVLGAIGNQTVDEGATLTFTINGTDADLPGNTLTFSTGPLPAGATFNATTRTFTWTPTEAQGPNIFTGITFTVTDGQGGTDSETISITVNEVNQAPVLGAIGNKTVQVGQTVTFTVTATDADLPANALTLSSNALPTDATFNATTGVFSWTPMAGQVGDTPLTFTVTDNGTPQLSDSETITVTVSAEANQAPVVNDQTFLIDENSATGTVVGTIAANDPDVGQALSYLLTGTAFGVNTATGQITVANSALLNFETTPSFTLTATVTDNGTPTLSDTAVITITLTDVNEAPVLGAIGNRAIDELATLSFLATATDVDAEQTATFTLDATSLGLGMTINATTGAFSWTPTEAQGPLLYNVTITVTDNGSPALSDSETIQIQVNEVNVDPVLGAIGDRTVDEGATLTFTISGTDADLPGQTLTFGAGPLPTGATFDPNTRTFSWTPTEAQGPGVFPGLTFTVNDGQGGTDSETISITVNEVNAAPVLGAIGNKTVQVGQTLSFTVTATDADFPANVLTLSSNALPTGATFDANTGLFSWTPTAGQTGDTPLTFTVTDNGSPVLSDSETITLTVTAETGGFPQPVQFDLPTVQNAINLEPNPLTKVLLPNTAFDFQLDYLDTGTAGSTGLGLRIHYDSTQLLPGQAGVSGVLTNLITVPDSTRLQGIQDQGDTSNFDGNTSTDRFILVAWADLSSAFPKGPAALFVAHFTSTAAFTGSTINFTTSSRPVGRALNAASIQLAAEQQQENTPPVVNDQSFAIAENSANGTVVGTIAATDPDVSQALSYLLTGTAFAVNPTTGQITVANSALLNFETTPSFTLTATVTDNGTPNLNDTAVITITLTDVNEAPLLGAIGNQTIAELATLSFLATATDVDAGQSSSFTLDAISLALGMTINATTGAFSWTPTEAQGPNTYNVTITVTDNGNPQQSDSETIQIQVNEVNVDPVLGAIGNRTVNEGETLTFTIAATDADVPGNTLTFSAGPLPDGATFNATTRTFSWTPTEAQGPGVFTGIIFTVIDGQGGTDSETISITVNEVNAAPVLGAIGNRTVQVGATLSFTVTATDADFPANVLTLSSDALPTGATFDANTGLFSWTPTAGQTGDTSLTFTVTDNGTPQLSDSETITLTVTAEPNQPPEVNDQSFTIAENSANGTVVGTIAANDPDVGQALSYLLTGTAFGVNTATGQITVANSALLNFETTPSFSLTATVTDNGTPNLNDTAVITITLTDVNEAPVLGAIGNRAIDELATLSFLATATDVDAEQTATFTLDATSLGLGMTINATTGAFSWTPTEAQGPNTYNVTITVTDNGNPQQSDSETIQITVNEVNVDPVLGAIGNRAVDEGATLTFTISGTDADLPGNTLTFSAGPLPAGANFNATTRTFSWTPTEAQGPGVFPGITFTVNDGQGGTDSETISITVNEVNAAPVLGAIGNKTVQVGQTLSFTVTATDADFPANVLTLSSDALPTGATFDANTGLFSWVPTAGQTGDTTLIFTVTDNGTPILSDSETITLTVTAEQGNRNPDAVDDAATTKKNQQVAFNVLANDNDPDGDTLTITAVTDPQHGTIEIQGACLVYTPDRNFTGTDSVVYTISDGNGGTDTATFTIRVLQDRNHKPQTQNDSYTVEEDGVLTVSGPGVLENDRDRDGDQLVASLVEGPDYGTLSLNADGSFVYTPDANFNGKDSFTYQASDGAEDSRITKVTIRVTSVNDEPVLDAIPDQTVEEGSKLKFTVTATDADGPKDKLRFSLDDGAPAGATINSKTGEFKWTPTAQQGPGVYEITVKVTDGEATDYQTFTVTVTDRIITETLIIRGTTGCDIIKVCEEDGGLLKVSINGNKTSYKLAAGTEIKVLGLDGDDIIILKGLNRDATVEGGKGDDIINGRGVHHGNLTLKGGNGNDILLGGKGNDLLKGGDGNDLLIGGAGCDTLIGGAGCDREYQDGGSRPAKEYQGSKSWLSEYLCGRG